MPTVIEHKKFSLTNLGNNNNKYWNVTLYDNDDVMSEWGRQGHSASTQSKTWYGVGRSFMETKIRTKEKKGYIENEVVEGSGTVTATTTAAVRNRDIKDIARKQIKHSNPLVQKLVDYLVDINAHNILTATKGRITYDTSTAQFRTTQGVVIPAQVLRARVLLNSISYEIANKNWDIEEELNEYLSLIPRDFGRSRMSPEDILPDLSSVQQENDLLDGLDVSFVGVTTTPTKKKKKKKSKKKDSAPQVFNVGMTIITDKKVISMIRNLYQQTRKSMHVSNNLSIKTVYSVDIASMKAAFDKYGAKLSNIRQLWHGTKASNLLSILRGGLIIPPSSSRHCTGRMYGDGIYFSSVSTKALNYATNFWGGGSSDRTFMFLADVAMGKYHLASGGWGNYPVSGTNSTWAKGGGSGVINDEMIVYRLDQANLVFLVEFCSRSSY